MFSWALRVQIFGEGQRYYYKKLEPWSLGATEGAPLFNRMAGRHSGPYTFGGLFPQAFASHSGLVSIDERLKVDSCLGCMPLILCAFGHRNPIWTKTSVLKGQFVPFAVPLPPRCVAQGMRQVFKQRVACCCIHASSWDTISV